MLWGHWLPTVPAGMTGVYTLSGTSSGPFWFSSSFTLEHRLQSFGPLSFLSFLVVGGFWEVFLVSFAWRWLFPLTGTLATWRKQERGREWHWFGEEGEGGWEGQLQEKGCGQRRVMCQARTGQGTYGVGQWARGVWVGSAHLDISLGPQLIGSLHPVVPATRSHVFHNYSGALWLPSHLSHFEASQWSAPEPLSTPIYSPRQGDTPSCFMRSASLFPSQWWPWVSLDITKPHPDTSSRRWGATEMFWWEKWGMYNSRKEASKLTCHPHLSKSSSMGHRAGRVCLLQSWSIMSIYDCKRVREF